MNKQQLASKIWQSANKMRSKIEANEYKDYILGFIFYKFLSDKELKMLRAEGMTQDEIESLTEDNSEAVSFIKNRIGYFMAYDDLFSTWLVKGSDFNVSNVRDALSAFNRHISSAHRKVFTGIFDTLQTGLSKLGDTAASQTNHPMRRFHGICTPPCSAVYQRASLPNWMHIGLRSPTYGLACLKTRERLMCRLRPIT